MKILAMWNLRVVAPDHTVPIRYAAPFVRSPLSAPPPAPPAPPAPPPRRQPYTVNTAVGPMPYEPDSVMFVNVLGDDRCEC